MDAKTQFKDATVELVALKIQIAAARKDVATLNTREKQLRKFVTQYMKLNYAEDTIKVAGDVKISYKVKHTKGSITRDVIKRGLSSYFGNDEVKVEGAFKAIEDAVSTKKVESISISGMKALEK